MKRIALFWIVLLVSQMSFGQGKNEDARFKNSSALIIKKTSVTFDESLEQLVFTITTKGQAGSLQPKAFGQTEGIVALALTSHPDFDDTPLWDENYDGNYANDGVIWHPHWVVLTADERVPGGLAVKQFDPEKEKVQLPPKNPGMPMYMDSPGF